MSDSQIHSIFSTPIGIYEINNYESLNKGLTDFLYSIKKEDNPQRSMVGGYHTKENLLFYDNTYIKEFHKIMSKKFKEYFYYISKKEVGENSKMASWGMIYNLGNYAKTHNHPLADMSASYYCKMPKELNDNGSIVFNDPRPTAKWDRNFSNNSTKSFKAKEGTLIIFPGWLEHHVTPHNSNEDRICISTNFFVDHGTFFK